MKKKIYAMLALSLPLFASCFSDDSNYDYADPLDIQVEGIQDQYSVSPGDVIQLRPTITPANRDYECFWTITPNNAQTLAAIDTVSKEQNWDYTVDRNIGAYKLRFCAKDKQTGIFAYKEYNLNVTTDMATGWWILKGDTDGTDIDFFSDNKVKRDVIYSVNGRKMQGDPLNLHFTLYYWVFDESTLRDVQTNAVFAASSSDIVALDYFTGKIVAGYEDLFVDLPAKRDVQSLFAGPSDVHVCIDNTVYTMYNSRYSMYKQFIIKSLGDYRLSTFHHCSHATLPILFDEKTSSFCTVSRNSPNLDFFADGTPSSKNLNMDMIYLGGKSTTATSQGDVALAVMKGKGTNDYQLFTLNGYPSSVSRNPVQQTSALNSNLQMLQAEHLALNQNNNIIYFEKNNKLYACNLDNQTENELDVVIPVGEEVTYMEFLKYSPYGLNDSWFDYLVIATAKNGNYKVYLHPVSAAIVLPAEKTFEGKGRVKRACFMKQESNGFYTTTLY
ncbi:MAG: hypothetical protein IJ604_08055 [Prevotella sp.]|nr:hypothetical protein [Prevotella sp.]